MPSIHYRLLMAHHSIRAGLSLLALIQGGLGLYAYVLPLTFYNGLPFPGHSWVDLLPPYNGHLVTDYGILSVSLAVILAAAAVFLEKRLVQAALSGYLVYAVLHLAFHVTHLERFPPADAITQTAAMILLVVLTVVLLFLAHWKLANRPA